MKLSQRLWNESSSDLFYDDVLDLILQHPGSCDDVWLTTLIGYPQKEEHHKYAQKLVGVAEKFRAAGISISLQAANTLGHGQYACAYDCSGLVYDGSPVEHMVGPDGTVAQLSFCPRGRHFRAYICETLAYYAPIKPDILWIDDDFRLLNHKPVDHGCFCDNCISLFNTRYGTNFTREALVEQILHGDLVWRERYLKFQREGMEEMMQEMMQTLAALSPGFVGGLQHAAPGGYIMGDHGYGFDPMYRVTGKAPVSRPGGGTYNDHTPHRFIEKGIHVAFQNARLPDYVKDVYPEVENIPHYAYGKTAEGTALETAYYLACGANNMSYSMLKYAEPIGHYGKFLQLLAAQRPYFERLARTNEQSAPSGLCYYTSHKSWQKCLEKGEGFAKLQGGAPMDGDQLFRDAFPITFDTKRDNVYLLHPTEAKQLAQEDIDYLLGQRVITDGESLLALAARGVDIGVDARLLDPFESLAIYQLYTSHAVNAGERKWKSSYFARGKKESCLFLDRTGKAEVLGYYASDTLKAPLCEDAAYPMGIAELVITTPQGGRWALLGYEPWKGIISKARRDHLLDVADYVAKAPVCARVLTPHQAILHPRVDAQGKTLCATVTNCSIAKCEGAELLIRNPKGEKFVFVAQYLAAQELPARREGEAFVVTLPTLDPWTQGTVFCEE